MEANRGKRKEYLEEIDDIDEKLLIYLDESGVDVNTTKEKGWGKIGKILRGKKSGKYYERINVIAGIDYRNNPIGAAQFKGSCNTELFNVWVEEIFVKELKPGYVVIMDNASFHKSKKAKELIEFAGCKVIFLPPYSPDLNPIEHFWANMKRWIKNHIDHFGHVDEAISHFFLQPNST